MVSAGTSFAASDNALGDGNITSLVSDDTLSVENNNDYIGNIVTSDDVLSNDYAGRNTHFSASDNVVYSHPTVKKDGASYAIFLSTSSIIPTPLNNKTVNVEFNGESSDYTTNSIGMINYIIPSNTRVGEFNIKMKFDGDDVYAGSSLTTSIKIVDVETKIIALENVSYSHHLIEEGLGIYPIALTTNSTIPTPLANKTVIVEFDDVGGEFLTDNLGLIYYKISKNCSLGNYTLKVTYAGDECYVASEFATSIEIFDVGTKFIAPENVVYSYFEVADGSATVPMFLATNTRIPLPLSNRTVYVEFNGIGTYCTTNRLGMIDYKLFESPVGNYTYTMSFEGDGKYNYSTATVNVEITKGNMTIYADYDYDASEIVATIINNFTGNPVANAKVKVSLNGADSTVKSNSKGQIRVSTSDLPLGEYTAIISYAGNSKYNPAEESVYFDVKTNMNITAAYDVFSDAIVATLINRATGKTIANANVHVDIDDMTYTVKTNSKGQAKVSTADLPQGAYTAIISYAGNSKYNPAITSIDFDIKTKVMITDIYGDSEKLTATLTNSETGKAVANAKMQVDINGVKTTVKSNSKGVITVSTADLGLTRYTATISYPGNSKYDPSSATATIDLDKSNMVITHLYDAEKQEMVATLKNSKTGKVVSNANMVIELNGVKTTLKSNDKGQIAFLTSDLPAGTYVGTITYGGNAKYNSISAAFKVDV